MSRSITAQEVQAGFESGLIRLIDADLFLGDGVACQIGSGSLSNWFYFAGMEGEGVSAEEYLKDVPMEDIIREIVDVLDDFQHGDVAEQDEWLFYRYMIDEMQG